MLRGDLRASQRLTKTTGLDSRPRCVSARQSFACSKDDSPVVITGFSNWRMFCFNVLCMITGLHHKPGNWCVYVCVYLSISSLKLCFFFLLLLFHPLIPVIFQRLPFLSVFRKVCVRRWKGAEDRLVSQTACRVASAPCRQTWQCVWPPAAAIHSHNNLIYPINR